MTLTLGRTMTITRSHSSTITLGSEVGNTFTSSYTNNGSVANGRYSLTLSLNGNATSSSVLATYTGAAKSVKGSMALPAMIFALAFAF
jgi:hypothetical protein